MNEKQDQDLQFYKMLELSAIASWQVPNAHKDPKILATLPSLQRNPIWKPKQIEELWDSLVRGFPVGSFMVTRYDDKRKFHLGQKNMVYSNNHLSNNTYTHYLLDGQQRANAIALGFIDPLLENDHSALLWVDLEAISSQHDDREFVFRVLNKYNPWGFSKNNSEQLRKNQIRESFAGFKNALKDNNYKDATPAKLPLRYAWPWDASTPIPVKFLWCRNKDDILQKLKQLNFWDSNDFKNYKENIEKAFNDDLDLSKRLDTILNRFSELINYKIPCLEVDINKSNLNSRNDSEKPDHIETLFVRVNSQGTELEGEELIYSILKSEWTNAPKFIENVPHHLFTPPRMVIAAARLILARNQIKKAQNPKEEIKEQPPIPNVSRFRRLMRSADKDENNFPKQMAQYFETNQQDSENKRNVFKTAHKLLTLEKDGNTGDYRLHPYLVTDLCRGSSGHEVMLLILRWIDRLHDEDINPLDLNDDTKKKFLGFITALSWFSVDAKKCIRRIWNDLQNMDGEGLKSFFNCDRFKMIIDIGGDDEIVLIPPLTPEIFKNSINDINSKNIESIVSENNKFTFYGHFIPYFSNTEYMLWNQLNDYINNDNGVIIVSS